MGMHPVAKFNLGNFKNLNTYHISIDGDNGKFMDLVFEPTSIPFWKGDRKELVGSFENIPPFFELRFPDSGDSGRRILRNLTFLVPSGAIYVPNSNTIFSVINIGPASQGALDSRGLSSSYYYISLELKEEYNRRLRTDKYIYLLDNIVLKYKDINYVFSFKLNP